MRIAEKRRMREISDKEKRKGMRNYAENGSGSNKTNEECKEMRMRKSKINKEKE